MPDYPFTLYLTQEKAFPTAVCDASGKAFDVNTDFRTILKIIDLLGDKDVFDGIKYKQMYMWFYGGKWPAPGEAYPLLMDFIAGHQRLLKGSKKGEPDYDFTCDADVIYSSVLKEFGIDLIEVPFLHWYKFKMMLAGLSAKSAFRQRQSIRAADLTGIKGKHLTEAKEAKEAVRIPKRIYAEDKAEQEEFVRQWG